MMMIIPTYVVRLEPDGGKQMFRVPRPELEAFIKVLLFNGHRDFRVTAEPDPLNSQMQAAQTAQNMGSLNTQRQR